MTLLAADQLDWYVGKPWAMIIDVRSRREYLGIPAEKAGGGSHTDSAAGFCIHIKQERKSDPERGTRIWQA